jgi:putative ABC transport system permease protein
MKILKLVTKNMLRHKLRSSLTILGVAIAGIAFILLQTLVEAWYVGVEGAAANRLITRNAVSFIFTLPLSYEQKIAAVPGVERVAFANWFGGVYIDKNQFFARLAVDAEDFFAVYPELLVPPDQMEAFQRERNACIIGKQIADRYNLKLGDLMTLEGDIYPGQWQFVVRGIYLPRDKMTDPSNMLFHWKYVDERMRTETPVRAGQIGWYVAQIKDPAKSAVISEAIDQNFKNSPAETKSETERAFQQGFLSAAGAIITATNVISFVVIGIIMLVLGNTMIMAARERVREYAVLKTLGFSRGHFIGLIGGEALLISALGGIVSLAISFPMIDVFEQVLPKGWFPVFELRPITVIFAFLSAFAVGICSSVIPLYRTLTTNIVNGLRQIG